jgi:hypothetical protein
MMIGNASGVSDVQGFFHFNEVKRNEGGLTLSAELETAGILVGDDLRIEVEASAIRSELAAAA